MIVSAFTRLSALAALSIPCCSALAADTNPTWKADVGEGALIGVNYGILFTAWGMGGLVLPRLQQMLTAKSGGNYTSSFLIAGVLLLVGAALTFLIKPPLKLPAAS